MALRGLVVKDPLHTGRLALQEDPSAVESGSQVTDDRDNGKRRSELASSPRAREEK